MKKRNDIKKGVKKIKKTGDSKVNKRRNQSEPDLWKEIRLNWKGIRSNLKPLGKAYNKFKGKRRVAKEKEERIRLKENEKQRLIEEEALRLQEQEERRFKKEKKIKEEKERRLKAQEKQRLEEKRLIEERNERIRQEQIYRERLIKGEEERIEQLKRVSELRNEEKKLIEERNSKIESRLVEEDRVNDEERISLNEVRKLEDEQKKKRFNGTVKWFNGVKGYGFIKREGKEKDIFVHFSAVKNSGLKYLKEGEQLTFEVEYSDKGPSAINLQKTDNEASRSYLKVIK